MNIFKRFTRKKKPPFGAEIEPSCRYCRFNMGEEEIRCPYKENSRPNEQDSCKKYIYDPLKREPKGAPRLRTYTKEDFEL